MVESTPAADAGAGAEALLGLAAGSPQVRLPRLSNLSHPSANDNNNTNNQPKHVQQKQYVTSHNTQPSLALPSQHPPSFRQLTSSMHTHPTERLPGIDLFNSNYPSLQRQMTDQISHTHPSQSQIHSQHPTSSIPHSSQPVQQSWNVSTATSTASLLGPPLPTPSLAHTSMSTPSYHSYTAQQWPSSHMDYSYPSHQQSYQYYNPHPSSVPHPQQTSHNAPSLPLQQLQPQQPLTQPPPPQPLHMAYPRTTPQPSSQTIRPSLSIPHVSNHSDKYYVDYPKSTPYRNEQQLPSVREMEQRSIMFPGANAASYTAPSSLQPSLLSLSTQNISPVTQSITNSSVKVDAQVSLKSSIETNPESAPPSRARGLADLINPTDTMPGSSDTIAPVGAKVQKTANSIVVNNEGVSGPSNEPNRIDAVVGDEKQIDKSEKEKHVIENSSETSKQQKGTVHSNENNESGGNDGKTGLEFIVTPQDKLNDLQMNQKNPDVPGKNVAAITQTEENCVQQTKKMPYDPITDDQPSESPKQKKRPPYHRNSQGNLQTPIAEYENNNKKPGINVSHCTKDDEKIRNESTGSKVQGPTLVMTSNEDHVHQPTETEAKEKESRDTHVHEKKIELSFTPKRNLIEEDDGEDEVDSNGTDDDEVTRCPCGSQENSGTMVACDQCNTWQHGKCMGFRRNSDVPNKYYCHICRPEEMRLNCIAHPKFKEKQNLKEKEIKTVRSDAEEKLATIKPTELRKILLSDLRDKKSLMKQPLNEVFTRYATLLIKLHFLKNKQSMIDGLRVVLDISRQDVSDRLDKALKKVQQNTFSKPFESSAEKKVSGSVTPKDRSSPDSGPKTPSARGPSQKRARPLSMNFEATSPNGQIRNDASSQGDLSAGEVDALSSDPGSHRAMSREERKLQQAMKIFAMMEEREREKKKPRMKDSGNSPRVTQPNRLKTPRISTPLKLCSPRTPTRAESVDADDMKLHSPSSQPSPRLAKTDPETLQTRRSSSPAAELRTDDTNKDNNRKDRVKESVERITIKKKEASSPETSNSSAQPRRKRFLSAVKDRSSFANVQKRRRTGSSKDAESSLESLELKTKIENTSKSQFVVPGPSVLGSKLVPVSKVSKLDSEHREHLATMTNEKKERMTKMWDRKEWVVSFPQIKPRTKGALSREGPMRKRNIVREDSLTLSVPHTPKLPPASKQTFLLPDEPKTVSVSMIVVSEKTSLPDKGRKLESSRLVLSELKRDEKISDLTEAHTKSFCLKKRFLTASLPTASEKMNLFATPTDKSVKNSTGKKEDDVKSSDHDNSEKIGKSDTFITPSIKEKRPECRSKKPERDGKNQGDPKSNSVIPKGNESTIGKGVGTESEKNSGCEKAAKPRANEKDEQPEQTVSEKKALISKKSDSERAIVGPTVSFDLKINKENETLASKSHKAKDETINIENSSKGAEETENTAPKNTVDKSSEISKPSHSSQVAPFATPLRSKAATPGLKLRSFRSMPISSARSPEPQTGSQLKHLRSVAPETSPKSSPTPAAGSTWGGSEDIGTSDLLLKRLEQGLLKPSASSPAIPTVNGITPPSRPVMSRHPSPPDHYNRNTRDSRLDMKQSNLNGFHRSHGPPYRSKPDGPPWGLPSFSSRRPYKPGPGRPYMNGTRSPPRHGMGAPPHRSDHFRPFGPRDKLRGGRMDDHWNNVTPSPSRWNSHGSRSSWGSSSRKGYNSSGDHYGRGGRRGRHGSA